MNTELLGTSRGYEVFIVDRYDVDEFKDIRNKILIDRSTYKVYFRGVYVGNLARNRREFSDFDDNKFAMVKAGTLTSDKNKKKVYTEEKSAAKETSMISVPSLLDNELKFDNSIFKTFADYIDNELKVLKEKKYEV